MKFLKIKFKNQKILTKEYVMGEKERKEFRKSN